MGEHMDNFRKLVKQEELNNRQKQTFSYVKQLYFIEPGFDVDNYEHLMGCPEKDLGDNEYAQDIRKINEEVVRTFESLGKEGITILGMALINPDECTLRQNAAIILGELGKRYHPHTENYKFIRGLLTSKAIGTGASIERDGYDFGSNVEPEGFVTARILHALNGMGVVEDSNK
ncbi:MAG: hypothetical protein NTU57_02105 [Candidatus Aenigmarchaeota archaeon]|nr:hypothetical protein [Candidatus Aenigmarchaeota archaeon]